MICAHVVTLLGQISELVSALIPRHPTKVSCDPKANQVPTVDAFDGYRAQRSLD
jgi:hypothetical protein